VIVKLDLLITKLILLKSDKDTEFVGGWVGDGIDWFGESFKKALIDFGKWLLQGLFDILSPFIEWGSKSVIVACIIIFYCTQDKKAVSTGIKFFFIYIIFLMIRSTIQ